MFLAIGSISIGFYISLCCYVDALAEDFEKSFSEINNEKCSELQAFKILEEAIFMHNKMFRYF